MNNFQDLLKRAGINKSELARRLGMCPKSISNWGDEPKQYAIAYLELLTEKNFYEEAGRMLERVAKAKTEIRYCHRS